MVCEIYKIDSVGNKILRNKDGELHAIDKPAVISFDGSMMWFFKGKLHRIDGPATIYVGGIKAWYFHGMLHRTDGPAIEYPDGTRYYYKGKQVTADCYYSNEFQIKMIMEK